MVRDIHDDAIETRRRLPADEPRGEQPLAVSDEKKKNAGPPWYKRRWVLPAAIVTGILALIATAIIVWYMRTYESTDDAYTAGHVVEISSQVPGRVLRVLVNDNQDVTAGETLVELDPRDFQSSLEQAQANLQVAQTEKVRAQDELARYNSIAPTGAATAQEREEALAAARKADAAVVQNQAAVDAAQLQLSYTKIVAPFAGRIAEKNVEPGGFVTQGQAMMALVDPNVWVVANFKETQLKLMRVGDKVRLKVDAFPGHVWWGHVDSIQPGSGAQFSLLPPENATGNFVKVVQRVPVKIVFDDYAPPTPGKGSGQPFLGVGLSVRPRVTVR